MSWYHYCLSWIAVWLQPMREFNKLPSVRPSTIAVGLPLIVCASMLAGSVLADESSRTRAFLNGIVGAWNGQAVTTPSGPRPYDMTFTRQSNNSVTATANPGNSQHHWTFSISKGQLHLSFLSTFRGNRTPRRFLPATFEEQGSVFRTKRPDRLTVRIRLTNECLDINVFRHARLHVAIRSVRGRKVGLCVVSQSP